MCNQYSLRNCGNFLSFHCFLLAKDYSEDYIKSVAPAQEPAPSSPVWKRPPGEWERDRIELAKLAYGKHALRHHEVPPYFETSQGGFAKITFLPGWVCKTT